MNELRGHWPLQGDCRDHSGSDNHGTAHGSGCTEGRFDGVATFVEIPASRSLDLRDRDFTLCAWVRPSDAGEDILGDVLSQYDPRRRRGFHLTMHASAGGYCGQGDDRHVHFGIDNGAEPQWEDCGRPSTGSNYVSNSLTVFDGALYAAITDAPEEQDWAHVFRYAGGQEWVDCGRVGSGKTRGVGPLVVHQRSLYAATWNYDWTRLTHDPLAGRDYPTDDCRVYRYRGGTEWEDCGQPGESRRLFGMASYRQALYVVGDDRACWVLGDEGRWKLCGRFLNYPHPMAVHDGHLYVGVLNPPGVHRYDGKRWRDLGNPGKVEERSNQIHALDVYRGRLHATTWPEGRVIRLEADDSWTDLGRLGDSLEINGLAVYNGKFYAGTIPRSELFRYDDEAGWTSVGRFLEPAEYQFGDLKEWARITSLTVHAGRLFASMGSCTSSHLDAPCDFRGKVYALEAGKCVSYDRDLRPGWNHLAAIRREGRLELHVNGRLEATSTAFDGASFDLSSEMPLRIGSGELDCFSGEIRDVRVYVGALAAGELAALAQNAPN